MSTELTLLDARFSITDYWDSPNNDRFGISDNEFCAHMVHVCEILETEGDEDDMNDVEDLMNTAPSIFDYDKHGNFIGNVPNENGITA
jgi:hypothetical protein